MSLIVATLSLHPSIAARLCIRASVSCVISPLVQVTTPQITWHGGENGKNDPVLSADVHPCGVLATGGADADIRVSVSQCTINVSPIIDGLGGDPTSSGGHGQST